MSKNPLKKSHFNSPTGDQNDDDDDDDLVEDINYVKNQIHSQHETDNVSHLKEEEESNIY